MKLLLSAAVATAALLVAGAASAQAITGVYGNLGYSHITNDDDGEDTAVGAITGRVGGRVLPWLAIEGQASLGIMDDEETVSGVTTSVGLNHELGVYAVGMFPVAPNADLFARVGFGLADFEAEIRGPSINLRAEEDATYRAAGVGGQFFWDGVNGVRGEYTYLDFYNEDAQGDMWSLSYVRKF